MRGEGFSLVIVCGVRAAPPHSQRSVTERGVRSSVVRRHAAIGRPTHVCLWMWHDRLVLPHVSSGKSSSGTVPCALIRALASASNKHRQAAHHR